MQVFKVLPIIQAFLRNYKRMCFTKTKNERGIKEIQEIGDLKQERDINNHPTPAHPKKMVDPITAKHHRTSRSD